MITFYPRQLALWGDEFDFNPTITLLPKAKTDHKVFRDLDEFFDFLKIHKVRFDDPENPLKITDDTNISDIRKIPGLKSVVQWSLLGWIKDDYR